MESAAGLPPRGIIARPAAAGAGDAGLTIDSVLGQAPPPDDDGAREERFDLPTGTFDGGGGSHEAEVEADADADANSGPPGASARLTPEARRLIATRDYVRRCCE